MKIEAGKFYKTRDGRKAFVSHEITNDLCPITYPFVGTIDGWRGEAPASWKSNGAFDQFERENDLIAEWKEPERIKGWLNIGKEPPSPDWHCFWASHIFSTRALADLAAQGNRIACIEIDVLEGEGLEGDAK